MLGNNSGIKMTSGKSNIILGNNIFMEKTSGSNNIFIGNGSANDIVGYNDNEADGMMVINNKESTFIVENVYSDSDYTDSNELCFLPVENSHIFDNDDVLKIYNSNIYNRNEQTPAYTDYYDFKLIQLGFDDSNTKYIKPLKNISHTFVGNIKINYVNSRYIFMDYSNNLRYVDFDTRNKITSSIDYTDTSANYILPIIYIATTESVKGIYQVWSKVLTGSDSDGTYDYIELKKLTSNGNTFSDKQLDSSNLDTLALGSSEGVSFTLSNSVLQLYLPVSPYRGRKNTEGTPLNIYLGEGFTSSTGMFSGDIVEKFTYNAIVNGSDNTIISTGTPNKYKLKISDKSVFNIGDKVSLHGNKTYASNNHTGFFVYKQESINDNNNQSYIYVCNESAIDSNLFNNKIRVFFINNDKYILIKKWEIRECNNPPTNLLKQDISMVFDLNSNKMVVNGNPSFLQKKDPSTPAENN